MQNEDLRICKHCGREFDFDCEGVRAEDTNNYFCDNCVDELYYCDECENYFENSENTIYIENECISVCQNCYEENFGQCHYCGDNFRTNNLIFDDSSYNFYCTECYEDLNISSRNYEFKDIYEYHDSRLPAFKPKFLDSEKEFKKGFGFELEVNYNDLNDSDTEFIYSKIPCRLCEDSSIGRGFEIITEPMTKKYFKSKMYDFKEVLEFLKERGYTSHDNGRCGLHIHYTRPKDEVIDRVLFIIETYKKELKAFSRRDDFGWCGWLSDNKSSDKFKSLEFIKEFKKESVGHHTALNLENKNTIEFRFFRGTLNFDTLLASIELVNNIMEACSDLKKPISDITWDYITRTSYAKKYVEKRQIISNIIPKDMTKELLKEFRKVKILKNSIIKILVYEINFINNHNEYNTKINVNLKMSENDYKNLIFEKTNNEQSNIQYKKNRIDVISQLVRDLFIYEKTNDIISYVNNWFYYNDSKIRVETKNKITNILNKYKTNINEGER